jgi:hypothetical protein
MVGGNEAGRVSWVRQETIMPRYHFRIEGDGPPVDGDYFELPDIDTARSQAVILTGAMLQEVDGDFWQESYWRLDLLDDTGLLLSSIEVQGSTAPAASPPALPLPKAT